MLEHEAALPTEDTLKLLDEPTPASVLELGCGSGHSLRYLAERGARELVRADLQLEALVETPLNPAAVKHEHADPARWYSVARAQTMPTTLIVKARKPLH